MTFFKKRKNERTKREKNKKNTMLVIHRKQIAAVSLMLMIAICGYLNWNFKNTFVDPDVAVMYNEASKKLGEAQMVNAVEAQPQAENNYFAQARIDRELSRGESMDMLKELINSPQTDKNSKLDAEEQINALADYTETEITIENMIKAKGFDEAVAFMGENLISVAVSTTGLSEEQAAVIQEIITSVSGYSPTSIKIVEVN